MLADLNNHSFNESFLARSNLLPVSHIQDRDVASLKSTLEKFFKQHPIIVDNTINYFRDDVVVYILKRMFHLSFTKDDVTRTNRLFNRFFIEHEENIKITFDYFFDDVKPLILKRQFPRVQFPHQYIDLAPKSLVRPVALYFLKKSGASCLTSLMYPNQTDLDRNQNRSLSNKSTSHKNKYFLLLLFFIMLWIIFGSEIFRFILYYFIGVICTAFALYLFVDF
jgi:hypothetical protein